MNMPWYEVTLYVALAVFAALFILSLISDIDSFVGADYGGASDGEAVFLMLNFKALSLAVVVFTLPFNMMPGKSVYFLAALGGGFAIATYLAVSWLFAQLTRLNSESIKDIEVGVDCEGSAYTTIGKDKPGKAKFVVNDTIVYRDAVLDVNSKATRIEAFRPLICCESGPATLVVIPK